MPNTDINPQLGVQGSSYLYNFGTTANTRTAVSQKIRLLAPAYGNNSALFQVGVLSTFDPSESKTVEPVRGIGFGDQIAELVSEGFNVFASQKGKGSVVAGIDLMKRFPICVHRSSTNMQMELQQYAWKRHANGD